MPELPLTEQILSVIAGATEKHGGYLGTDKNIGILKKLTGVKRSDIEASLWILYEQGLIEEDLKSGVLYYSITPKYLDEVSKRTAHREQDLVISNVSKEDITRLSNGETINKIIQIPEYAPLSVSLSKKGNTLKLFVKGTNAHGEPFYFLKFCK